MKKILIIFASIVAFLCLFTVAFQWYFNPSRLPRLPKRTENEIIKETLSKLEDSNRAKYYLNASLMLVDTSGVDPEVFDRLDEVMKEGWQKEDLGLEKLIEVNEPALDQVRKGLQQNACSMPMTENEYVSYLSGFRQIARLFIAKAKLCESKGASDRAQETYSDLLHFGRDISDSGTIIHALTGMAIEGLAYFSMEPYVNNLKDVTACQRLLNELVDIEKNRVPLHDVLQREFIDARKFYEDVDPEEFLYYRVSLDKSFTAIDYFTDTAKKVWGYLLFHLERPRLLRERDNFDEVLLEESKKPYAEIFDGHLEKKIPKDGLADMFNRLFALAPITRFESMTMFIRSFTEYSVRHRAAIIEVALHEFYLKNGNYPEALDELVPSVPEVALTDPFSMKRFIYNKTAAGYRFYSVGPDLRDDHGEPIVRPYSQQSKGDFVFEVPNPER